MEAKRLHDCPVCGRVEAIRVVLEPGDYSVGIGDYPEITSECGCIISAEAADAILDPWFAMDGVKMINELMDDPL